MGVNGARAEAKCRCNSIGHSAKIREKKTVEKLDRQH